MLLLFNKWITRMFKAWISLSLMRLEFVVH